MTLMCIERSQTETHKATVLQGRKSSVSSNSHPRRNSCSPPLAKTMCLNQSQQQQDSAAKNASSSAKLERSVSEPASERKVQQSNSSRYKTELCRPFEENGTCKYGDKCQFAHGEKELRSMARHPKYKTELCRTFHSTGLCPYGPRCHFIHNSEQTKKKLLTNLACSTAPIAPVGRPKALTSLGSAGDLSPSSSNGGSPTGTDNKCFDDIFCQGSLSPVFFPHEYSTYYHKLFDNAQEFNPDLFDSVSVLSEKMLSASESSVDNYPCDNGTVLNLFPTAPLTPSTPNENNFNNYFPFTFFKN